MRCTSPAPSALWWRGATRALRSLALAVPLLPIAVALGSPMGAGSAPVASVPAAAAAPKAYVGLFKDNAVAVLDTGTNRVLSTIAVPAGPHGIVVSPDGGQVFVSSDGASTVSVIDTASDQIGQSIEVGQAPHGLAITPDGSQVLVAVFGTSQVAFIDTVTQRVVGQVPVPQPHNIAITPDGRTAYVAAQQSGSTQLAIVDVASRTQVGSVPLEHTPRALSFSPDGRRLYFTAAGVDAVEVLDPASNQVVAEIAVGASPHFPLLTPGGDLGLVVSQGPGELDLLSPTDNTERGVVPVGKMPHWIALSGDGQTAYVTDEGSNDVSVVDLKTSNVAATIQVGQAPRKIVVQPTASAAAAPAAALPAQEVRIARFAFAPSTVTASPGQTVTWTNGDAVRHNVASNDGVWQSTDVGPGERFSATLTQPGAYPYHCAIHPFMTGTIVVTG